MSVLARLLGHSQLVTRSQYQSELFIRGVSEELTFDCLWYR